MIASAAPHDADSLNGVQPVIIAGGSGTRLWPLSRGLYPKQLLALAGERSMLQATASRLPADLVGRNPLVIGNVDHRFVVAEQLRDADIEPAGIILEPCRRNTAAAIAAATAWLGENPAPGSAGADDDPVLAVMPADHVIQPVDAFQAALGRAAAVARAGWLVTLGVAPDRPHTGYGYIRYGAALPGDAEAYQVAAFTEKPDAATAESYLAQGGYAWNAGIFIATASTLGTELARHAPALWDRVRAAVANTQADLDFERLPERIFADVPDEPFDRAVMERTERGAVVTLSLQWSDVGTWHAVWEMDERDGSGNSVSGDVIAADTADSLIRSESRLVATLGVSGLTVVETADAVLVADRRQSDRVQDIARRLKRQGRREAESSDRNYRPWGYFETLDLAARYQVKRIVVHPGCQLSAQRHYHRAEHWVIVSGTARVTQDGEQTLLSENQSTYLPLGSVHRLENPGKVDLEVIEVQSGAYLGEDDIERFEDVYNR